MNSWDRMFFGILREVKKKSKDPSTKVAAVAVGAHREVLAVGFNGIPRGVKDAEVSMVDLTPDSCVAHYISRDDRRVKYYFYEHAERNLVYNCAGVGIALRGSTVYLEYPPCADCARALIQAGVKELVLRPEKTYTHKDFWRRWKTSCGYGKLMMAESGVKTRVA